MSTFFAGLDWASQIHVVCVIDEQGQVQERLDVAHDAAGLAGLLQRMKHWGRPPIAIERPSGMVVDTLVEAGLTVVPIHPNAVKATRPRYRSHGAKSDASDAYLLADLLGTDGHRFKPLMPQSDEIRALRALVRGRDDLVATRVQLANQLRSLLDSFWPGAAAVFADIDSPIALAFIERYPTPECAARLGQKRMAAFCAQHAYCGRRTPEDLLERLHRAPAPVCAELEMEAKGELARCLARTLVRLVEQIKLLSSRIEHQVAALDDGRILMSFPATRQPLGLPPLRQCTGQRLRSSARRSHPRQGLAARHLACLDRSQTLRPRQPSRRSIGSQYQRGLTQGVSQVYAGLRRHRFGGSRTRARMLPRQTSRSERHRAQRRTNQTRHR